MVWRILTAIGGLSMLISFCFSPEGKAAPGTVTSSVMISRPSAGFPGILEEGDLFGTSVATIADLDGDGIREVAIGAMGDDGGGALRGAVWILFLNSDGYVRTAQKINSLEGGFLGQLDDGDQFGSAVADLGDLDGDGIGDIAVGSMLDDDGGTDQGAVWILFLNSNGTVAHHQKISENSGGFTGNLDPDDRFARSIATLGDVNADGVEDLAVGAPNDDDNGSNQGAVWILFLNNDGTLHSHEKISELSGGFGSGLDAGDNFGFVGRLGDLDGDCVPDLAVGAIQDDDGGANRGAVWILFLNTNGTVKTKQKLSDTSGNFVGTLADGDSFGISCAALSQLKNDTPGVLAVGAMGDDSGGTDRGAIWILFLRTNGTVQFHTKISSTSGGLLAPLVNGDRFGSSVGDVGDLNGDGITDLVGGAYFSDDLGADKGAAWIMFLDGDALSGLPSVNTIACSQPSSSNVAVAAEFAARPGQLAVSPSGQIYVGNYYFSGQDGDNAAVFRINGMMQDACPCGPVIPDPDVIVMDHHGSIAPAGDLIVGTADGLFSLDSDCSSSNQLIAWPHLSYNPQDIEMDGSGRVVFFSASDSTVYAYNGASIDVVVARDAQPRTIAIDSLDIYVSVIDPYSGFNVQRRELSGGVIDAEFTRGKVLKIVRIADWKGLLVQRSDSLTLVRLPSREECTLATGVADLIDADVDSEGYLILAQINARRLLRVTPTLTSGSVAGAPKVEGVLSLHVTPNPLTRSASVLLGLQAENEVVVNVYDVTGRLLRSLSRSVLAAGEHTIQWDGLDSQSKSVSCGVYYIEVRAGDHRERRKVVVVR